MSVSERLRAWQEGWELLDPAELFDGDAEPPEHLLKQRRTNGTVSMDRDDNHAPVRVDPTFVAAASAGKFKSQPCRGSLKITRGCARHE